MTGNAKNTNQWAGADVYIAPLGTAGPTDLVSSWPSAWQPVGLLDGEEGFTEAREDETSERYAWGGILVRRSKSKHKRTIRFVALEDNDVTFDLINPGSTRSVTDGVRTSVVKVPASGVKFAIGFETRDGARIKRRVAETAEVDAVAEIKDAENEPSIFDVTTILFPDADGVLYTDIETDPEA